ncbi:DNA repair protein RecN [Winogradskyella aurantia]|uniref:DNA repair protein RecN n=1 Tax=Winogradskyella aurantia TaxID=1915063 RepID=A0A265UMF0_9FLAO|nr:DNA repair protein RecN [Winogradskyella aurantia]OZV66439.1 DNA repair protein RecN [Winogradskyella aurantia]
MLSSLYIKNYALIDELNVQFNNGLTIITGETGAGKSILLGGLALVLGKRADLSQVKNKDKKCVIEATFDLANYDLKNVFGELDLDYDVQTIVRREILPSGKSRAFINDTPTILDNLVQLSENLIDVHAQHQTQQLTQDHFQFQVIDALANNKALLTEYITGLGDFKTLEKALDELKASKSEMLKEYDYNLFLLNELNEINLETLDLDELEARFEALNNVEEIGEKLQTIKEILNVDDLGVIAQLQTVKRELSKIGGYGKPYEKLKERIESVNIELDDLNLELDSLEDNLMTEPEELDRINSQLQIINNLMQKHAVLDIKSLIELKAELNTKINTTENLDDEIAQKEKDLAIKQSYLEELCDGISNNRKKVIPTLSNKLESILKDLGMPNAKFKIELTQKERFGPNGTDNLNFLFMANKGSRFNELKKAASGGELSRIMLAIKSILAEYIQLPTIVFDEIDTGVSGEISNKMGSIMKQMSKYMQVLTITHLPQIAAKGDAHFKVFKQDKNNATHTKLQRLNEDERIVEIAQMLGGLDVSESALAHARQLLN